MEEGGGGGEVEGEGVTKVEGEDEGVTLSKLFVLFFSKSLDRLIGAATLYVRRNLLSEDIRSSCTPVLRGTCPELI